MTKEQIEQAFKEKYPYAIDAMKEAFIAGIELSNQYSKDYEYFLKEIRLITDGVVPSPNEDLNEIHHICNISLGYDESEGEEYEAT